MQKCKSTIGHITALITILIWGTTFISTKVLLEDFAPVEILFFRFCIGFVALMIAYPHYLRLTSHKQELLFAGAGLCGVTLYFLLENIALTYSFASNVAIILAVAPFFTALMAHWFLRGEKLQVSFFIGFVCAIIGIILIRYNESAVFQLNPLGDLLAVLAAAVWAVYSILIRKISAFGYNTIQTTRRTFFYGLLFMIPALFLFDFHPDFSRFADPTNLGNILFLGLGASAVCFATWGVAVKRLGAVKTSVYIYLSPVITLIASTLILHEPVTWIALLGAAFTLVGLCLSEAPWKNFGKNIAFSKTTHSTKKQ